MLTSRRIIARLLPETRSTAEFRFDFPNFVRERRIVRPPRLRPAGWDAITVMPIFQRAAKPSYRQAPRLGFVGRVDNDAAGSCGDVELGHGSSPFLIWRGFRVRNEHTHSHI